MWRAILIYNLCYSPWKVKINWIFSFLYRIQNEWIKKPETSEAARAALIKKVSILKMTPHERTLLHEHLSKLTKCTLDGEEKAKLAMATRKARKLSGSLQSSSCSSNTSSIFSLFDSSLTSTNSSQPNQKMWPYSKNIECNRKQSVKQQQNKKQRKNNKHYQVDQQNTQTQKYTRRRQANKTM